MARRSTGHARWHGTALAGALTALTFLSNAAPALAGVPASWPFEEVELGLRDPERGAVALRARGSYGLRYHYLSGGVNTGQGWQTWTQGDGSFVPAYVADSREHGFATVFSYYQLYQSAPANGQGDEAQAVLSNLRNVDTMRAYFDDLETFFHRAAESGDPGIVLHVEPDVWGYFQAASGVTAASVPAAVASTGRPDLAGLADNVAGFARAIVRLRDAYAPNVLLGYHLSPWGSGIDPALSTHLSDERIDEAAGHSAAFYASLGAPFDLTFAEYANRDAGYMQAVDGLGSEADWGNEDFGWHARFIDDFSAAVRRPVVMWQIPFGNTIMRAVNDTRFHYHDNKVERLLGDRTAAEMQRYTNAGAIAFLFGTAIPGTTCACDAAGDGITNPPPIYANDMASFSADDDGGYFHRIADEWYAQRQPALTDPKIRARARVGRAVAGERVPIELKLTSSVRLSARLVLEIRRRGRELGRIVRTSRLGESVRRVQLRWRIPRRAEPGRATLALVVKGKRNGRTLASNPTLATFRVRGARR